MSTQWRKISPILCAAVVFFGTTSLSAAQTMNTVMGSALELERKGAATEAVNILRQWRSKNSMTAPSIDFQLLYARLLLQQNQGVEALGVLRTIQNQSLNTQQQEQYTQLQLDYALYKANQMRLQGDSQGAANVLAPVLEQRQQDPYVMQANAGIQHDLGNETQAYQQYKRATSSLQASGDASLYLGLARTAASQNKKAEADAALQQVLQLEPENPRYLSAVRDEYAQLGRMDQVGALTQRINILKASHLPVLDETAYGSNRREAVGQRAAPLSGNLLPTTALQNEYDAIMGDRSASIHVGAQTVHREGDAGTSRLRRFDEPVEVMFPAGNNHIKLQVSPVQLHAGKLKNNPYAVNTFGGGPVAADAQEQGMVNPVGRQQYQGLGGSVAYVGENVEVDVGVTPVGFEYQNFAGGVKLSGNLDDENTLSYRVNLSRRAITESLLSFSGTRDPRTGQRWGGVMATGVRADLTKEVNDVGVYGSLAWHYIDGHNVMSNRRTEGNLGFYTHVINDIDELLTIGANLNATLYDNNQRYFTYGHGGYFSPQHSYSLAFPIDWAARTDRVSYMVGASVGVTQFKEDSVDMYPTNHGLQNQAAQALANKTSSTGLSDILDGVYSGQRKTTVSYNVKGAMEYKLTPQTFIGGNVGINNSNDYKQWGGGIFFRYYFHPQEKALGLPVRQRGTPYEQNNTFGGQ